MEAEGQEKSKYAPETLPEFMSSPGFGAYTTPSHPGFLADFKSIPEDFVVTEINSKNQLVVLDTFEAPPPLDSPPPAPAQADAESANTKTAESTGGKLHPDPATAPPLHPDPAMAPPLHPDPAMAPPLHPDPAMAPPLHPDPATPPPLHPDPVTAPPLHPDPATAPPLQQLVTPEQYDALHQLALNYKRTLVHDPEEQVELGIVKDKESRSLLHFAIHLTFPVLRSLTYKDKQGDSGMAAIANSKYKRLLEVFSPEEAERVLRFVNTARGSPDSYLMLTPDTSKQHRTQVHRVLSELFGNYVSTKYLADSRSQPPGTHSQSCTDPLEEPDPPEMPPSKVPKLDAGGERPSPCIVLRVRGKHRKLARKGAGEGDRADVYTKFVLKKRNKESLDAVQRLSHLLHCSPAVFQTSGIKDKKAVTTQEVTVKGISPESVLQVRDQLTRDRMDVGNCERVKQHLTVGGHCGNRFKVLLRSLQLKSGDGTTDSALPSEEGVMTSDLQGVVTSALRSAETNGFINYFGLQRLNTSLSLPRVGLAMLRNDVKGAVNLALLEGGRLSSDIKDNIRNGQYGAALRALSADLTRERLLLQKLHQYGHTEYACRRGLMMLPYSVRTLYVHSLSSLLWNHTASYRIQEYGLRPVEGDLVMRERGESRGELSSREWVHVLSSEDVRNEVYSLKDVLIPTIGAATIYPGNRVADRMKVMMAAIGLTAASFRVSWLGINSAGVYRHLVAYPRNMSWKFSKSVSPQLSVSPRTPVQQITPREDLLPVSGPSVLKQQVKEHNLSEQAVNLEMNFDLDTSTYATMFIREVAKNVY